MAVPPDCPSRGGPTGASADDILKVIVSAQGASGLSRNSKWKPAGSRWRAVFLRPRIFVPKCHSAQTNPFAKGFIGPHFSTCNYFDRPAGCRAFRFSRKLEEEGPPVHAGGPFANGNMSCLVRSTP